MASTSQAQRSTPSQPLAGPSSSTSDPSKSKRELEQDHSDAEIAQLLEQMDEYKPVVSHPPSPLPTDPIETIDPARRAPRSLTK